MGALVTRTAQVSWQGDLVGPPADLQTTARVRLAGTEITLEARLARD